MNETCLGWGIECGNGWFELLRQLLIDLEAINNDRTEGIPKAYAEQIKQKFGELRFYIAYADDQMDEEIKLATGRSRRTCECCGKPGELEAGKTGWLSTLCEECRGE